MKVVLQGLITVYQGTLSPLLGPRCRFYPSCSQYAKECLGLYPLHVAGTKIARRLLSCHPLHPGGIDLP
jgi:putative membrane protein insertion efficiency factor